MRSGEHVDGGVQHGGGGGGEASRGAAGEHDAHGPAHLAGGKEASDRDRGREASRPCRCVCQGNPSSTERGSGGSVETRKCHKCGMEGHLKNCPVKEEAVAAANPSRGFKNGERTVKCYNCEIYEHVSMHYPEKSSYNCKDGRGRSVAWAGLVEGTAVSDILLDTGCTRKMVRRGLVPEDNLLPGEAVTVLCAHGDTALYLLARVRIDVEGLKMEVKAAVSESLPVSALLGTDTVQLGQLLQYNPLAVHTGPRVHPSTVEAAR